MAKEPEMKKREKITATGKTAKATAMEKPATPVQSFQPFGVIRTTSGVIAPGNEELTAIQSTHKDVTMKSLTEGYALYTSVCTDCHASKPIYPIPEANWPGIIDDMAEKARITAEQKDALTKYVMAIKATQPK